VTRPGPDEAAVREQLEEEAARVEEKAEGDGSPSAAAPEPEDEPEDEVTVAKREREEYLQLAQRTQADFENYRKRAAKDIAAAGSRARSGLIRELLPVVDNLERTLAHASADDGLAEGVKLVLMDLRGVLQREGVETIEPEGQKFDPNLHEALSTREQEGIEAGVVLDVVEKGYRSPDAVIRPARVIVAA
jgi:molecular chaperone GrpE